MSLHEFAEEEAQLSDTQEAADMLRSNADLAQPVLALESLSLDACLRKIVDVWWSTARDLAQVSPSGSALNAERQVARLFWALKKLVAAEIVQGGVAAQLAEVATLRATIRQLERELATARKKATPDGLAGRLASIEKSLAVLAGPRPRASVTGKAAHAGLAGRVQATT